MKFTDAFFFLRAAAQNLRIRTIRMYGRKNTVYIRNGAQERLRQKVIIPPQ